MSNAPISPGKAGRSGRRPPGFTLIEVLVVVAIIALLISILIPSLRSAREVSRRSLCAANIHQIGLAIEMYAGERKGTMPHMSNHPGRENTLRYIWSSRHFRGGPATEADGFANLGHLWPRYLRESEVFYCPSVTDPMYQHSSYQPFPELNNKFNPSEQLVRVGYNYNPHVKLPGDKDHPELVDYERLYKKIDDKRLRGKTLVVDMVSQIYNDEVFAHKISKAEAGWNLMISDGSVHFRRSREAMHHVHMMSNANYDTFIYVLKVLEKGL